MAQGNLSNLFLLSITVLLLTVSFVGSQESGKIDQAHEAGKSKASTTAKPTATTVKPIATSTGKPKVENSDCSGNASCGSNSTGNDETSLWNKVKHTVQENKGMLLRTFYVLIGLTAIVIVYFVVRAWRIRRRRSKSRKYGLITTRGSDLEMAPLDQDDDEDDEDMTVFELNNRRKK